MEVTVVCLGALRERLPDPASGRMTLELPDDAGVDAVIDALGAPRSLVRMCLIDGQHVEAAQRLHEGAEVTLMPPFSGGSTIVRSGDG